jgi:protein-disulfide isomerase
VAAVLAALAVTAFLGRSNAASQATAAASAEVLRADSHRLSTAKDEKAVLVEFLDFECESCRAAYPFNEELRAKHGDRLTIVSRYFPLPGHPNPMTADVAAEAAAQQGKFEDMYHRLFETQTEWSHTRNPGPAPSAATLKTWAWTWQPTTTPWPTLPPPPGWKRTAKTASG